MAKEQVKHYLIRFPGYHDNWHESRKVLEKTFGRRLHSADYEGKTDHFVVTGIKSWVIEQIKSSGLPLELKTEISPEKQKKRYGWNRDPEVIQKIKERRPSL